MAQPLLASFRCLDLLRGSPSLSQIAWKFTKERHPQVASVRCVNVDCFDLYYPQQSPRAVMYVQVKKRT